MVSCTYQSIIKHSDSSVQRPFAGKSQTQLINTETLDSDRGPSWADEPRGDPFGG